MIERPDPMESDDAALIERMAAALRSPERLDPSFEDRLMAKVRVEGRANSAETRTWWRKPRVVRFAPLTGVALAAGISAFLVLSGIAIGSRISLRSSGQTSAPTVADVHARTDTVQVVRFVFVDQRAKTIELVGDFNAWTKGATKLAPSGAPGVWAVSIPLAPGRHEYAFIINGIKWSTDPLAIRSSDDFDTESSVIHVSSSAESAT
jgi:Glycogen recognition site of AMP-activated protein kinase